MSAVKKVRLDQLAVEKGLFASRSQAQAAIMAGELFSNGQLMAKPGQMVKPEISLSFKSKRLRYVGRGGYKLEGALKDFKLAVVNWNCLDVGSSTGGFTDVLLKNGAHHVCCVDVGKGQLDINLRNDERVTVMEGVNARYLTPDDVPGPFDLAVIDVSFISLKKILPVIAPLVKSRKGYILALIKPQFEVGPAAIGKGGIVRDKKARDLAVQHVLEEVSFMGLKKIGVKPSCIKGTDGNQEFLALMERIQ